MEVIVVKRLKQFVLVILISLSVSVNIIVTRSNEFGCSNRQTPDHVEPLLMDKDEIPSDSPLTIESSKSDKPSLSTYEDHVPEGSSGTIASFKPSNESIVKHKGSGRESIPHI